MLKLEEDLPLIDATLVHPVAKTMMYTRTALVLSLATFALAVPVSQIGEPPSDSPGSLVNGYYSWVTSAVSSIADGMVYLVILGFVLLTSESWSSNSERTSIWSRCRKMMTRRGCPSLRAATSRNGRSTGSDAPMIQQ
ncbi:hypothetical protein EDB92DRAFT_517272 [Lactarius akahatsu]|uniref:Uncharacterized protein n=1 Tax=Lactarius akahatsu TaxID=416441 RepID=A0AAD4QE90_9AGAM|nr:hypothetical protein EDB92DRAFT_517272 [Lactarius akahatsu]